MIMGDINILVNDFPAILESNYQLTQSQAMQTDRADVNSFLEPH